jgi:hypothetical protein
MSKSTICNITFSKRISPLIDDNEIVIISGKNARWLADELVELVEESQKQASNKGEK